MSELRTNRIVPRDGLPSGSSGGIIQVRNSIATDVTNNNTSSNTFWNTSLSVTIAPTRSDSKLLIWGHVCVSVVGPQYNIGLAIYKDGSVLDGARGDAASNRSRVLSSCSNNTNSDHMPSMAYSYMDSAGSTSSRTYSIAIFNPSSTTRQIYLNRSVDDEDQSYFTRGASVITVMEVTG